jgi:S-adenosylmethionine synthetase
MDLYVAGRATNEYRGVKVPVEDLTVGACRSWLAAHMHALDASRHARVHCLLRPGSADLVGLFARQCHGAPHLANDTSMGAGFAPATPLELAVLEAERCLRSFEAPECGEDIKVMGVRTGERVSFTVACAFVDKYLRTLDAYLSARDRAALQVRSATAEILGAEPAVTVNAADDPSAGSLYLTVTGTSAEAGDDGQTGRGNRLNGLITPSRPMVIESFAGKNPVSHVGKLYNVAAQRVAGALISGLADIEEAHVLLVARIGAPVNQPEVVHVGLRGKNVDSDVRLAAWAREITKSHVDRIGSLSELLLASNLVTDRLPVL